MSKVFHPLVLQRLPQTHPTAFKINYLIDLNVPCYKKCNLQQTQLPNWQEIKTKQTLCLYIIHAQGQFYCPCVILKQIEELKFQGKTSRSVQITQTSDSAIFPQNRIVQERQESDVISVFYFKNKFDWITCLCWVDEFNS